MSQNNNNNPNLTNTLLAVGAVGAGVFAMWQLWASNKAQQAENEKLRQKMEEMQMLQMRQMQEQQQQFMLQQQSLMQAQVQAQNMQQQPQTPVILHTPSPLQNNSSLRVTHTNQPSSPNLNGTMSSLAVEEPPLNSSFSGLDGLRPTNSGSPTPTPSDVGAGGRGGYPSEGPPTFQSTRSLGSQLQSASSGNIERHPSVMYRGAYDETVGSQSNLGNSTLGVPQQSGIGNGSFGQRERSVSQHNGREATDRGRTANDSVNDFLAKKRAMNEAKMDLLRHVPSFRGVDDGFLTRISGHLQHETYEADATVCVEGEYGDCMYFVASGLCEGFRKGKFFKKFAEGNYFGEVALLRGVVRSVTVQTLTQTDLFYLSREPFLEAIAEYPSVRDAMEKEIYHRYEEAKYTTAQRRDPAVRKRIEEAVQLQYAKMKAQYNKKMKWQLNQKIGSGAAGEVYSAINLGTGQPMAVKVLAIAGASRSLLLSVSQESEMMQRLRHPNLVQGFGMEKDDDEGYLYIFMELLPMGSIQKVLKEFGPLSETAARMYAKQMLSGLQYLHEHGVLHRDIKPGNMLISAQGSVKLADFGISRYGTSVATATITGTPAYMSPDAINGKYSIASDIWAMGCSILEMITRRVPWQELELEGPTQLLFHIAMSNTTPTIPEAYSAEEFTRAASAATVGTSPDESSPLDEKISPQLYDLLKIMMAPTPADRTDCAALLKHEWFTVDEDQLPSQPHRLQQLSSDCYGLDDNDVEKTTESNFNASAYRDADC